MSKKSTDTSKFLSYILRHEPEAIALTLDKEGWAVIDDLILRAGNKGYALDKDLIFDVVESSEKKLFVISADGLRIRECSGALHSASQYHLRRENASRYFISRYCNSFYLSNISTLSLNGIKHWGFFI